MMWHARAAECDWHRLAIALAGPIIAVACCPPVAAVDDVLLQTMKGQIVTGIVDDQTSLGTLGTRVFPQQFLSNFRSANPGFFSLATGNPNLPPSVEGFPSNHDVSFDLLPMTAGLVSSNLLYWDCSDLDGDGLELDDVNFVRPLGMVWEVFDANFSMYTADGTDELVPGGLIQRTSSDIDPLDGIDTGSIHKHLALQLRDDDGNLDTSPAQGIYMIAWQARSAGFETSDPFLFVLRTSTVSDAVRDLAADWALTNIDVLTSPLRLSGDYNQNDVVDAADYVVWRNSLGQMGMDLAADGDGNGTIDAGDHDLWRANFGATGGSGASFRDDPNGRATVPEPPLLSLCCVALARTMGMRRVRCAISD
jgi:hypothetical protein